MAKRNENELASSEKVFFFGELSKHYKDLKNDYWLAKGFVLDLFVKAVNVVIEESGEEDLELSEREMTDIFYDLFSPDYLEEIQKDKSKDWINWIQTWIGCLYWVIQNDKEVFSWEYMELYRE